MRSAGLANWGKQGAVHILATKAAPTWKWARLAPGWGSEAEDIYR